MLSRDELVMQLTNQWVKKAQEDMDAAEALLVSDSNLWPIVAFHCQQSAEKYIKALLTFMQIEFGKTHDITILVEKFAEIKSELSKAIRPAEALTVYGVQARYPGDGPDVDQIEAEHARDLAQLVARLVREELGQNKIP